MTKNVLGIVMLMLGVISVQNVHAQPEQFKFKHIDINNGLSDPAVRAILKDSKGFIWVSTSFGLNRFDGYTVRAFFHDPRDTTSLIDDGILRLFEAPEGILVVQTAAGLNLYNPEKENFDRRPEPFL